MSSLFTGRVKRALYSLSPGARMLIGMAVGDAFGARFENLKREEISFPSPPGYNGRTRYTDDTQMALAVVSLMTAGDEFTPRTLAEHLLSCWRADPRQGYSPVTGRMLRESETAENFLSFLPPAEIAERRSDGSAMRALPLGWYPDLDTVINNAAISSRITHGHPDAILATEAVAVIAWLRYHKKTSFSDIATHLLHILDTRMTCNQKEYLTELTQNKKISPKLILREHASYGVPYTQAIILLGAVIAILKTCGNDPGSVLEESIRLGGDTDTTAAIALGVALIYPEKETLYQGLFDDLENGPFGRDYLISQGDILSLTYPPVISDER